jgi:hypothetical protein
VRDFFGWRRRVVFDRHLNRREEVLMANTKGVATELLEAFDAHDEGGMRELEAPGEVRFECPEATTAHAMAWLSAFRLDFEAHGVGTTLVPLVVRR